MKITAQSLAVVRQTMMDARKLLILHLHEDGASTQRRYIVQRRIQELSDAIKLIDEGLGYAMPTHEEVKNA